MKNFCHDFTINVNLNQMKFGLFFLSNLRSLDTSSDQRIPLRLFLYEVLQRGKIIDTIS